MRGVRQSSRGQRGSVMIVALVALTALLGLGSLAVLSVQGTSSANANDRFSSVARLAAESGIAAGMEFLRDNFDDSDNWSALVRPDNAEVAPERGITGNAVPSGETGNPLSDDLRAWYEVEILNNDNDPGFATGEDTDARVVLRARGHGPDGAVAVVEVELQRDGGARTGPVPCPSYAQKNITEHGAGHNPCLGTIDPTARVIERPGGRP